MWIDQNIVKPTWKKVHGLKHCEQGLRASSIVSEDLPAFLNLNRIVHQVFADLSVAKVKNDHSKDGSGWWCLGRGPNNLCSSQR